MLSQNKNGAFKVEVTVTPTEGEIVAKSESPQSTEMRFSRVFQVSKAIEDKREIVCVAMVANEIDAHGDMFTPEAVEFAANNFLAHYNLSKDIGADHDGSRPDLDLVGNWYTEEGGNFSGLDAPPFSWVAKLKVNDDDIWESVKSGERTGLSIQGPAWGYAVEQDAQVSKFKVSKSEGGETKSVERPKRIFTMADPDNLDLVNQGANLKVLIYKARDNTMTKNSKTEAPETIKIDAVKGSTGDVPGAPTSPADKPAEVAKGQTPEADPQGVQASPSATAEELAKAKAVTESRKKQAAELYASARAHAADLGVDLAEIDNPPDDGEQVEIAKARAMGESLAAELAKSIKPMTDTVAELTKRLDALETARDGSAVVEDDDPAPAPKAKRDSPFNGAFDGLFSKG